MDLWPLRSLALDLNLQAHGVAVTVLGETGVVTTRGIWLRPLEEDRPFGTDRQRREPRRVLALRRADVPAVPRGTVLSAPERAGGPVLAWKADGLERSGDADHWRVVVVQG